MKKYIKKYFKFLIILFWNIRKKPFSYGYGLARQEKIISILKKNKSKKIHIRNCYGFDERLVEYKLVFDELEKMDNKLILDAGSTLNFKYLLDKIIKKNKIFIETLFPENENFNTDGVSYIYNDLTNSKFKDNCFDVITCISVLEHVGFDNSSYIFNNNNFSSIPKKNKSIYLTSIKEFKRILKINGKLLITIPFGKKMMFNHLQQFNNNDIKDIISTFKPKKYLLRFFKYHNGIWSEVREKECLDSQIRVDQTSKTSDNLASARSICFLKLIK
jgi:predicted SAM-dependent methyltransferase